MPLRDTPGPTEQEGSSAEASDNLAITASIEQYVLWLSKYPEAQQAVGRLQTIAKLVTEAGQRGDIDGVEAEAILSKNVISPLQDIYFSLTYRDRLITECEVFLAQPNLDPTITGSAEKIKTELTAFQGLLPQRWAIQSLSVRLADLKVQQGINDENPVSGIGSTLKRGIKKLGI